jgi:hypothetical protein
LTGKDAPSNNNTNNSNETNTQSILRRSQRMRTGRVTFAEASKSRKKIAKTDGQGPAPKLAPKTAQAKRGIERFLVTWRRGERCGDGKAPIMLAQVEMSGPNGPKF